MKRAIFLSIIFIFLFIGTTYAQITIKAEVDKASITTDDEITYKLTIITSLKNTPNPQLPAFEGFRVISQAQSSTISFKKSKFEMLLVYVYILKPQAAGKFTVGPTTVKFKGETFSTDTFQIEVAQGTGQPPTKPGEEPSLPEQPSMPDSEQPKVTL